MSEGWSASALRRKLREAGSQIPATPPDQLPIAKTQTREGVIAEFARFRSQLNALGVWPKFRKMWRDARAAALRQVSK